ncbi:MAG: hypothetical protein OXE52_09340 [Chloroflexi bacterium]|nr:hypothetical protein [Chloroflexota bacterium]
MLRQLLRERWQCDRHGLLLYLLTFLVMSYPFVTRMHSHLPMDNVDTHQALWQNWWVLEALTQGRDLNYTPYLFHPGGLDYTLQPPRWTGLVFWIPLYMLFGDPFAFNMTAAIGILLRAYGMYLFGLLIFKRRIPAWVCGAFYAFASANLTHALQQPFTGASEWIPWFMLAFVYGLMRIRARANTRSVYWTMLVAAFLFSLNVYANLKIGIFAMLLGGGFVALYMIVHRLWALRNFWTSMIMFGLASIAICAPSLLPMIRSEDLFAAASDPVVADVWGGMDLLTYLKADHDRPLNYMQSIASLGGDDVEHTFVTWGLSHVGLVSIFFAFAGLVYAIRIERPVLIWFILALVFWLLSLGVVIYIDGSALDFYWTPYRLLEDNFIFRALKWPFRMALVFLFPYSVLIGYGLHYRTRSIVLVSVSKSRKFRKVPPIPRPLPPQGGKGSLSRAIIAFKPPPSLWGRGFGGGGKAWHFSHYLLALTLNQKRRALLIGSVIALLYGASIFPIPTRDAPRPLYLSKLAELPDGAIIDVPFGRHVSKYYMSVQRYHGRPIAEGMIARVPPGTYDYINQNLLLATFRDPGKINYEDLTLDDWEADFKQLLDDGFRYLVMHREVPVSSFIGRAKGWALEMFKIEPKLYDDNNVIIYDLADVNAENVLSRAKRLLAD